MTEYQLKIIETSIFIVFSFIIAALVKLFRMRWKAEANLSCFICPYPRHWLLGHLYLGRDQEKILQFLCSICTEVNDVSQCWIGPFHCYLGMASVDSMRAILSTSEPKDEYSTSMVHPWIGDGLLLSSGNKWARNRRLLTKAFHFETLKPYAKTFNTSANDLIKKWEMLCLSSTDRETTIEICEHLSLLALDNLLKCIFGIESNCQTHAHTSYHSYLEGVSALSDIFIQRLLFPPYHIDFIFHVCPIGWRWRRACRNVRTFAANVIRKRRQAKVREEFKTAAGSHVDFLDMLLRAQDDNGVGLTDKEIQDEVNTFMFAGHDTTASTLSWMLYSLAKHPQYQQKCREEADFILRRRDSDEFEWEDLADMTFLTMCLKESMRINTTVPTITRRIQNPLRFPDGRVAPAGTFITIPLYGYHHNENIWPDADTFKPERFSAENVRDRSPFAFIPFSAGPRNCIGQYFAMQEMKIVVALLIRNFEFSVDEKANPVVKYHSIVLKALNGVHLNITSRKPVDVISV